MKSIYTEKITEENLIRYLPNVNMSERDKEIICKYLEENIARNDLAEEYNISRERIRQIEAKALRKLRMGSARAALKGFEYI